MSKFHEFLYLPLSRSRISPFADVVYIILYQHSTTFGTLDEKEWVFLFSLQTIFFSILSLSSIQIPALRYSLYLFKHQLIHKCIVNCLKSYDKWVNTICTFTPVKPQSAEWLPHASLKIINNNVKYIL